MQTKKIGKILSIKFGLDGYNGAMLGVALTLGTSEWGVGDFKGTWSGKHTPTCKWKEADRIEYLGALALTIGGWLEDAKVVSLDQLKNIPVEVTFEDQTIKSWRILKEVL